METFLNFVVADLHQEAFARRSLVCVYNLILQARITDEETILKIIPVLESKVTSLVNLRYNEEAALALSQNFSEKSPSIKVRILSLFVERNPIRDGPNIDKMILIIYIRLNLVENILVYL